MAEAAALVLAVLPLIISAAEHYSDASHAFTRYQRFAPEVSNLSTVLRAQRAIFTSANRRLLASCVGQDQAKHMLDDSKHPGWTDEDTEILVIERLSDSRRTFIDLIGLIDSTLSYLEEENMRLEGAVNDPQDV